VFVKSIPAGPTGSGRRGRSWRSPASSRCSRCRRWTCPGCPWSAEKESVEKRPVLKRTRGAGEGHPEVNFIPRGEFIPQGWFYPQGCTLSHSGGICPPGVKFIPQGRTFSYTGEDLLFAPPFFLTFNSVYTWEWTKGWEFPLGCRVHLGAKFTPRGKIVLLKAVKKLAKNWRF
jgi:hypothetical protein